MYLCTYNDRVAGLVYLSSERGAIAIDSKIGSFLDACFFVFVFFLCEVNGEADCNDVYNRGRARGVASEIARRRSVIPPYEQSKGRVTEDY